MQHQLDKAEKEAADAKAELRQVSYLTSVKQLAYVRACTDSQANIAESAQT